MLIKFNFMQLFAVLYSFIQYLSVIQIIIFHVITGFGYSLYMTIHAEFEIILYKALTEE